MEGEGQHFIPKCNPLFKKSYKLGKNLPFEKSHLLKVVKSPLLIKLTFQIKQNLNF